MSSSCPTRVHRYRPGMGRPAGATARRREERTRKATARSASSGRPRACSSSSPRRRTSTWCPSTRASTRMASVPSAWRSAARAVSSSSWSSRSTRPSTTSGSGVPTPPTSISSSGATPRRSSTTASAGCAPTTRVTPLPAPAAPCPAVGTQGQFGTTSLPPNNQAHTFNLAGGINLPLRTRVNANVTYSLRLQNQDFQQQTYSNGLVGDEPEPAAAGEEPTRQRADLPRSTST